MDRDETCVAVRELKVHRPMHAREGVDAGWVVEIVGFRRRRGSGIESGSTNSR